MIKIYDKVKILGGCKFIHKLLKQLFINDVWEDTTMWKDETIFSIN